MHVYIKKCEKRIYEDMIIIFFISMDGNYMYQIVVVKLLYRCNQICKSNQVSLLTNPE